MLPSFFLHCSSPQTKGQLRCRSLHKLLFSDSSSFQTSRFRTCATGTHPHSVHYSLELQINSCNSVVHLASNKSTELFSFGGDWDLSGSTSTQSTGKHDSLAAIPHASDPTGAAATTARGNEEHSARYCACCNPFKSLFASL